MSDFLISWWTNERILDEDALIAWWEKFLTFMLIFRTFSSSLHLGHKYTWSGDWTFSSYSSRRRLTQWMALNISMDTHAKNCRNSPWERLERVQGRELASSFPELLVEASQGLNAFLCFLMEFCMPFYSICICTTRFCEDRIHVAKWSNRIKVSVGRSLAFWYTQGQKSQDSS